MEELRTTEIFAAPGLRLIAIESIAIVRYRSECCCGMSAALVPRAVIAIGAHGIDALDTETGKAITLDRLRRDHPGLDAILASILDTPGA